MTEGHTHRMLKVKEGGLVQRLLTGLVLYRSTDKAMVERSNMVWHCEPEDLATGPYLLRPLGLLHWLTGLVLDTQERGFLRRAIHKVIHTWGQARGDSSNGEMTHGQIGDYRGYHLTHGWWVDPYDWSVGLSVCNDFHDRGPLYPGQISFGIEVGPFDWSLTLHQPTPHGHPAGVVRTHWLLDRLAKALIPKPYYDREDPDSTIPKGMFKGFTNAERDRVIQMQGHWHRIGDEPAVHFPAYVDEAAESSMAQRSKEYVEAVERIKAGTVQCGWQFSDASPCVLPVNHIEKHTNSVGRVW